MGAGMSRAHTFEREFEMLATANEIEQQNKDMFELESMIDRLGMSEIMLLLVHICDEKAEHIRSNWQDEGLAKRWDIVVDSLISKRLSKALGGLPKY
tara:strand:+ start:479 stop:769 length:291 start_codon:yes stop_codon:yes gene_type:complete